MPGPEFDFKTLSAVTTTVLGTSVLLGFKEFFETPGTLAAVLIEGLKNVPGPGRVWVQNRRREILKSLFSLWRLLLSAFFLLLIIGVCVVVVVGPERILDATWGPLAEPLSMPERILYVVLLVPTAAAYIWRVALPYWKAWKAVFLATLWLRRERRKR
jgi:hypothetical protein